MDACLYEPEDCESERTVIISELQGGDNDPEQLLDIEVNAAAFKVHPYHHPTIGWLSDLQTMTRDDPRPLPPLHRRPTPFVIAGDVDTDDVLKRVEKQFGGIAPGVRPAPVKQVEPEQQAERRVVLRKPGTTAYWKAAFHAPAFQDPAFFPMLVADAVLNGAAGLNIWSMGGVARPQRSARLYRALVDNDLASSWRGLMPTDHLPLLDHASVAEAVDRRG
jgi:zinc protease